jgi:hypothetical protein
MRTQSLFLLSFCALAVLTLFGCAKLQDTSPAPVAPGIAVHPAGWSQTTSPNFHGLAIAANGWDMRPCRTCHGQTYSGGAVNVSCLTCHTKGAGPENCTTCHGGANAAPPKDLENNTSTTARGVGAHQVHLVGPRDLSSVIITCSDCHHVPAAVYDQGHLDSPPPAGVMINNPLAKIPSGGLTPTPTYDYATGKCSNMFCHGTWRLPKLGTDYSFVFQDSATAMTGGSFAPVWNGGSSQADCGTCHSSVATEGPSIVPVGHNYSAISGCAGCHAGVVDGTGKIIDPTKHINGKVNVFGREYDFR